MGINKYTILSIIVAVFSFGVNGTRPLVPLFAQEMGANSIEIGIVISMFPFLSLVFAIQIGKIVDRLGYKQPLIWSSILGTFSLIIPVILESVIGLILSQVILGISNTIFIVSAQSYAGQSSIGSERDYNIMKFSIGMAIGSFIGPLIGGYLADWNSSSFSFFILGIISATSAIFCLLLSGYRKTVFDSNKGNFSSSFQLFKITNIRKAFLISSLILLGKDMFTSYFPLLALEMGVSITKIGIIVSINALAGIIVRWGMPYLINRFGKSRVIVFSVFFSGLFFLLLPLFNIEMILFIFSFFLGVALGLGQPLSISTTLYSLPKDRIAEGLALRLTVNRLTQTVAPFSFGIIAQLFSLSSIFYITGTIILIGTTKTKINEFELSDKF